MKQKLQQLRQALLSVTSFGENWEIFSISGMMGKIKKDQRLSNPYSQAYENLANNLADTSRYIRQSLNIIKYYRDNDPYYNDGYNDDSDDCSKGIIP